MLISSYLILRFVGAWIIFTKVIDPFRQERNSAPAVSCWCCSLSLLCHIVHSLSNFDVLRQAAPSFSGASCRFRLKDGET